MLWLGIPVFALGLLILWLGLRGFRIDDHPICRRCRFDLVGRPPSTEPRCPECGSNLDSPRATRTGNRRRSRRAMIAGALILTLAVTGAGALTWARAKGFNWNSVKPLWLLKREARANSHPALDEILQRIAGKYLSPEALDALTAEALTLQADRAKPWEPKWGDVVEVMHLSGALDAESWKTYVKQAVTLTLVPRSPVRVGDPVPFRILEEDRVGNGNLLGLELSVAAMCVNGVDGSIQPNPDPRFQAGPEHKGSFGLYHHGLRTIVPEHRGPGWIVKPYEPDPLQNYAWQLTWPRPTSTGRAELTVTLDAKSSEYNRGEQVLPDDSYPGRPVSSSVLFEETIRLNATFDVVPAETQTVSVVTGDAVLREQIAQKITPEEATSPARANYGARVEIGHDNILFARGMISVGSLPIGFAFDVFWKRGDKEWHVGRIATGPVEHRVSLGYSRSITGFEEGPTTIILRPSLDAARADPELVRIWGEEVVLPPIDIKVVERAIRTPRAPR